MPSCYHIIISFISSSLTPFRYYFRAYPPFFPPFIFITLKQETRFKFLFSSSENRPALRASKRKLYLYVSMEYVLERHNLRQQLQKVNYTYTQTCVNWY